MGGKARQFHPAILPARKRAGGEDVLRFQPAIEMREQGAVAGGLPADFFAKGFEVDGGDHKPGLAGEMFVDGFVELCRGGEMDVAVL